MCTSICFGVLYVETLTSNKLITIVYKYLNNVNDTSRYRALRANRCDSNNHKIRTATSCYKLHRGWLQERKRRKEGLEHHWSFKDWIYSPFSAADSAIPTSTMMLLITRRFWGLLESGVDTVTVVGTASPLTKPVLKLIEEVEGVEEVEEVADVVEVGV